MQTIVIFSHGFGVRKDAKGLFVDIAITLQQQGIETVSFDYNEYNEETKELFALSFSKQAIKLQQIINNTHIKYPDSKIIIIGHSQGCIIPTLCDLSLVNGIIMLGPFFHTKMKDVVGRHTKVSGNTLDLTGISYRKRSDGTTTVIPAAYWEDRFNIDVVQKYNELSLKKETYIIYGMQDEIMEFTDHDKIKNAYMINVDGDHNFSKQYRSGLINIITHIFKSFLN